MKVYVKDTLKRYVISDAEKYTFFEVDGNVSVGCGRFQIDVLLLDKSIQACMNEDGFLEDQNQ